MNQPSFQSTAKVFFTTVIGVQEAELYSDLIQGLLDISASVSGEVYVEQFDFLKGTDVFDIFIKFQPLKEEYENVESCKAYTRIFLQAEHIKLLKQQLGM